MLLYLEEFQFVASVHIMLIFLIFLSILYPATLFKSFTLILSLVDSFDDHITWKQSWFYFLYF